MGRLASKISSSSVMRAVASANSLIKASNRLRWIVRLVRTEEARDALEQSAFLHRTG